MEEPHLSSAPSLLKVNLDMTNFLIWSLAVNLGTNKLQI